MAYETYTLLAINPSSHRLLRRRTNPGLHVPGADNWETVVQVGLSDLQYNANVTGLAPGKDDK